MPYTQVICMKCAAEYMQETDPWGNYYPINAYMCGHCGSRDIYKKELSDEEAYGMMDTHNIRESYS
jgi:DNA-directed RNA polymerase subunit RPC12/RpoP